MKFEGDFNRESQTAKCVADNKFEIEDNAWKKCVNGKANNDITHNFGDSKSPTIFLGIQCPTLLSPPSSPETGWAVKTDVGETLGPCLGRDLYESGTSDFPSCQIVSAGRVMDNIVDNGLMGFKAMLKFDRAAIDALTVDSLIVEVVFSHSVAAGSVEVITIYT